MSDTDLELLARYSRHRAEDAFAELVRRHLDLVHSAALRQVRSAQLAEDVAQATFLKLARHAGQLAPDTILTAWLYQVARRESIDVLRRETRRQSREQVGNEMNATNSTVEDWTQVEPLLDEAMEALDETDRTAVLLRYFENKSLREVGASLGASEDAARKRVARAVERLREFLSRRGTNVGASGLAVVISAHAVQAAPAGLSATIATMASTAMITAAGTTVSGVTLTASVHQTIAMTTLQKTLMGTVLVAAMGIAVFQTREAARLRETNREQRRQHDALAQEIERLKGEQAAASARLAELSNPTGGPKTIPSEVLKLRGQVGVLRQEKAELGRKSALSKVTADPSARKAMRDTQKIGMKSLYAEMLKGLGLTAEQQERFHDLLADDVMENIDLITQSLQDNSDRAEVDRRFSDQESALRDKVAAMLGPDGAAQFEEYSRDLAGTLTALQFESNLTGDKEVRAEKRQKLMQSMREETESALAAAGLPPNYQSLPMLNFRNIASADAAEHSLKLMGDVFGRVSTRAHEFLSPDEVKSLQAFGQKALENNRSMLLMNRKMMAPIAE